MFNKQPVSSCHFLKRVKEEEGLSKIWNEGHFCSVLSSITASVSPQILHLGWQIQNLCLGDFFYFFPSRHCLLFKKKKGGGDFNISCSPCYEIFYWLCFPTKPSDFIFYSEWNHSAKVPTALTAFLFSQSIRVSSGQIFKSFKLLLNLLSDFPSYGERANVSPQIRQTSCSFF